MPFPDLPPERLPGSPGHMPDHELITDALEYVKQSGYRDDPDFPPLPDTPVLGQSGHVTAHDRILAILEYVKGNPSGAFVWATVSNTPTGTYKGDDGHTYAYYLFESDGTLTVTTAGLLEVLLCGAGSPGGTSYGYGSGGQVLTGLHPFDAGSLSVQIGLPGSKSTTYGLSGASALGELVTGISGLGMSTAGPQQNAPFVTTITGQPLEVSGRLSNMGTYGGGGTSGQAGVVIAKTRLN